MLQDTITCLSHPAFLSHLIISPTPYVSTNRISNQPINPPRIPITRIPSLTSFPRNSSHRSSATNRYSLFSLYLLYEVRNTTVVSDKLKSEVRKAMYVTYTQKTLSH